MPWRNWSMAWRCSFQSWSSVISIMCFSKRRMSSAPALRCILSLDLLDDHLAQTVLIEVFVLLKAPAMACFESNSTRRACSSHLYSTAPQAIQAGCIR